MPIEPLESASPISTGPFVVTPAAGKRLIAKDVAAMPVVLAAPRTNTVAVISGMVNGYIAEEILASLGEKVFPAVSASASRRDDGGVCLSLCNLDPEYSQLVDCELRGGQPAAVAGRILTGAAMDSHNTFESPDTVCPREFECAPPRGSRLGIPLPPKSVVVLQMR